MTGEKYTRKIRLLLEQLENKGAELAIIIVCIVIVFLLLVTISLTATYISLSSNLTPPVFYKAVSDQFVGLVFPKFPLVGEDRYISSLSLVLNTMITNVTIVFALAPILAIIKYRADQRKKGFTKSRPIYQDGVDDLQIMLKHFKGAEEVTIRSGDFSWLEHNQELCGILQDLSGRQKLCLVSYKSKSEVKRGINNDQLFNELLPCFLFDYLDKIKCSFVTRNGSDVFLYKYSVHEGDDYKSFILELTQTNETSYLLDVLGALMA